MMMSRTTLGYGQCKRCGSRTDPVVILGRTLWLDVCDDCVAAVNEARRDTALEVSRRIARSRMPGDVQRWRDDLAQASNWGLRRWCEQYRNMWQLVLGPSGEGKSLAVAQAMLTRLRDGDDGLWLTFPLWVAECEKGNRRMADDLAAMKGVQVLCLDDVDGGFMTDGLRRAVFGMIVERDHRGLTTYVTSNSNREQLEMTFGEDRYRQIRRRFVEYGKMLYWNPVRNGGVWVSEQRRGGVTAEAVVGGFDGRRDG